ncbi:MAG TPA: hypothetical protein ENG42_00080 [Candidatus Aenigmarchaeota archaeon]|nr:MAG: hypothetical protein DRP03_00485 [Candidatus Aenigmarchaeota archaeon]HDD45849.1 hypothetical protein [Candidatus Aenigmarchaeota archaeon]
MRTEVYEAVSVAIGVSILIFSIFIFPSLFPDLVFLTPLLNISGALIAVVPPFLFFYKKYLEKRAMEEYFIVFISDLTEDIDSGMTLPVALRYIAKRDYGVLTPYIKELASKVSWGIPFEEALKIFATKVGSVTIKRSVNTILQTYKVGGKLSDTLRAISQSLIEISKIKKERSVSVQSQIVTSYLIFFVFIFILIILQTVLVPAFSTKATEAGSSIGAVLPTEIYNSVFINFIIVQGFFAGLATGKMAEGSVIAGFKHSVVLITAGYTIFSLFSQLQIKLM